MTAISLAGCAEDAKETARETFATHHLDAEALYNYGIDALRGGRYKLASTQFEQLQKDYPYSGYVANAELMEGYAYYLHGDYPQSVQQLERYLQLHPTSADAAYAFYLRSLCYYEQIAPVSRDQLGTAEAMEALQEVVTRFPETSYARDAQLKIDLCRDHLAGKELMVGRYYQHQKQYQAALGRYQRVVQDFQTTNHVPEALERLVEVNLNLGLLGEAQMAGAVLGYNYPGSVWYKDAYAHLKHQKDLLPPADANKKPTAPSNGGLQVSESIAATSLAPITSGAPSTPGKRPPLNLPGTRPIAESYAPDGGLFTILGDGLSDGLDWFFDLAPPPPGSAEAAQNAAWDAAHKPKPKEKRRQPGVLIPTHPENKLVPSGNQEIIRKPKMTDSAENTPQTGDNSQTPVPFANAGQSENLPPPPAPPSYPTQNGETSLAEGSTQPPMPFQPQEPATATHPIHSENLDAIPASKVPGQYEDLPLPPAPPSYPNDDTASTLASGNSWAQMISPDEQTAHQTLSKTKKKAVQKK
ncbi:outer membrane protein assembly factor BamD [Acetobacteraceae bacterium]|nr:outer membrane protein assembly factor BamD [Acetobacteraceae bacterium]